MSLKGKTLFITGASRGIGLAIGIRAARDGANIVIAAKTAEPHKKLPGTIYSAAEAVEKAGGAALRDLAREVGVPLLFGSDQIERSPDRMYNAAFLVKPDGQTGAVYRKMHLVPFGEFIPAKRWLYFVSPLVERLTDFSPGASVVMLPVGTHLVSTAICYEVTYPWLAREAVRQGSEMLTTVTNDAWYAESSAPFQHFEMAAMRAIEQGRYLARAANTGISGIIDPYGRVLVRTELFETVAVVGEARFVQARTLYSRIGDLLPHLSIMTVLIALTVAYRGARRRNP